MYCIKIFHRLSCHVSYLSVSFSSHDLFNCSFYTAANDTNVELFQYSHDAENFLLRAFQKEHPQRLVEYRFYIMNIITLAEVEVVAYTGSYSFTCSSGNIVVNTSKNVMPIKPNYKDMLPGELLRRKRAGEDIDWEEVSRQRNE